MPTIEIPCQLGDLVYHVSETKYKGDDMPELHYAIIKSVVSAIHLGRALKIGMAQTKKEEYIKLVSVNTGYMSHRIPFDRFNQDCFYTYAEAKAEVERRVALEWL